MLWEINAHKTAFENVLNSRLLQGLLNGAQESVVPDTPAEYQELYEACWNRNSLFWPDISKIVEILKHLTDNLDIGRRKWDPGKTFTRLSLASLAFLRLGSNVVSRTVALAGFLSLAEAIREVADAFLKPYEGSESNCNRKTDGNYLEQFQALYYVHQI